ncbi:stage III sporulation protein AA [Salsuginibacillus kocurii]|uniref:stage III sporulation protein AA n=1 Tax=Salsuginibacillus kocurii TaxID=427078 RepID=UPI0003A97AA7|nr:stage III sporulation protein AA [Salsuginibacillus kocurii]
MEQALNQVSWFDLLPPPIQTVLSEQLMDTSGLEEIRLRVGQPIECVSHESSRLLGGREPKGLYLFNRTDANHLLNQLSRYSVYAYEEEIRQGFLTIAGGHRVGLSGKARIVDGQVQTLQDISSFNIRIAKHVELDTSKLYPYLYNQRWMQTVIVGSPGSGKTTLLRELARMASTGSNSLNISPKRTVIVDERSELAASIDGVPSFDLGRRIDVLDRCPKAEGMMMMIRSMNPDVLVVDEIGRAEDAEALNEATMAGVSVFCSVHGSSFSDVKKRPVMRSLFNDKVFDRILFLSTPRNRRQVSIYDHSQQLGVISI